MLPLLCHPSASSPASPAASPFSPKFGGTPKSPAAATDKKRHRLRPTNCCCWIAFDVHTNCVHYVPIFEEDIVCAKAVEPNVLAKSICSSIRSLATFPQQHQTGVWPVNSLTAFFTYVCALIDQHCAGSESNGSPPPRVPIKAVIVVPTNCSQLYQMAVEGAAEAAGIGQVYLIRRATAIAISYRMLCLDDDEAQLCKRQQQKHTSTGATEGDGDGTETSALIVQLDSDDGEQPQQREEKFVAILYICDHSIELAIYDFLPHHLPRLISSKMLIFTDQTTQTDLINKFLRNHLTTFRFKLFKVLAVGVLKQIASIVPTIKKHIDPSSCQLLLNCPMLRSADLSAVFGAALHGVHAMFGTAVEDGADRSPLFLSRAMVPSFDYTDSGGEEDEAVVEQVEKWQREVEAIDESFIKTFGLSKQISPEPSSANEFEQTGANHRVESITPSTKSDVTLSERLHHKSGTSSATAICCDEAVTAESFFDAMLPREYHRQSQQQHEQHLQRACTTTVARRQLSEDERRLLADVIVTTTVPTIDASSDPPSMETATTASAVAANTEAGFINEQAMTYEQHAQQRHQDYAASTTSSSYACTVSSKHSSGRDGALQVATPAAAAAAAACSSSTSKCSATFVALRAAGSVSRRFSDPLLRQRGACGAEGRAWKGNVFSIAAQQLPTKANAAENAADTLEAANRMRWEETDDEEEGEANEIETLGDDRSIICGELQEAGPLFSSSECPSGISSPLPPGVAAPMAQSLDAENDADDDDDNAGNSTAPAVELNRWGQPVDSALLWPHFTCEGLRLPWQKAPKRGRTRNRNKRLQLPPHDTAADLTTTTTMPRASAITTPMPIVRPSSRASTLQAMSDDEEHANAIHYGAGDDDYAGAGRGSCDGKRVTAMPTTNNGNGSNSNNYGNSRTTGYGRDAGRPSAAAAATVTGPQQQPTAALRGRGDDGADDDHGGGDDLLLLLIFGPQRPLTGCISATIEQQFYLPLPLYGVGQISSVQLTGLPLAWINNKFFQQEFKEWVRIRSGLRSQELINCFITLSVSAGQAFRICRFGRNSTMPFNGPHNQLFVYALLPTPEVAWHVCWACNQFEDNLGNYWPSKYGQMKFKPTIIMAPRQTFLEEINQ